MLTHWFVFYSMKDNRFDFQGSVKDRIASSVKRAKFRLISSIKDNQLESRHHIRKQEPLSYHWNERFFKNLSDKSWLTSWICKGD